MVGTESFICNPCKGTENCKKYCPVKAGENIVNFVNGISNSTVETKIGELQSERLNGKNNRLAVTGYMIEKGALPIDLLTVFPKDGITIKSKFIECWGMTPAQILKSYMIYANKPKEVQNKAIDDLKYILSPKIIPIITNIGSDIEVCITDFSGKKKKVITTVKMLKWTLDIKGGDLKGIIFAEVNKLEDGSNLAKLSMGDYGNTWTLPNLERTLKTSEIDRNSIKMYDVGLIAPIEIISKSTYLAVDNSYAYQVKNNEIYVIGEWKDKSLKYYADTDSLLNDKAFNKLEAISKFVSKHRRFIVPYGLGKPNKIEVK